MLLLLQDCHPSSAPTVPWGFQIHQHRVALLLLLLLALRRS
jgi:hypothetical protein